MKFLTNDKYYLHDLTMKELLDEYKAIEEKASSEAMIYITIPSESSLRKEYAERFDDYQKHKEYIAFRIADMLTK